MQVIIDEGSGCCNGVVRALRKAEEILDEKGSLYSLGAIVHNGTEIKRLADKGLKIIDQEAFGNMHGTTVLIRAHGEPPATYETAQKNGINIVDCTCPVVLKLQQRIAETYRKTGKEGGQIVIFGKRGHAEVLGLVGQVGGHATVIQNLAELDEVLESGKLQLDHPIAIFSQTTKDLKEYEQVCQRLEEEILRKTGDISKYTTTHSICRQVSSRNTQLAEFSEKMDVIIFVSGKESSNGHVLCELCRIHNPRTYMIEDSSEIQAEWFRKEDKIGICGATSTPKWQLEKISQAISALCC